MSHDIRELTSGTDLARSLEVFGTGMVGMTTPTGDVTGFVEPGRPLGAFVAGEMVGTAASFSSWLIVPGGRRLPQAAVTDVGVLPTHTRQGIGSALLCRQLEQIAARREPVATLRASEAAIYGRFGYGVASSLLSAEVTLARAALRPGVPAGGPVRYLGTDGRWDLLARIYDGIRRVGAVDRPPLWWRGVEWSTGRWPEPSYVVVHGPPGAEDGFARFRPGTTPWMSSPDRALVVDDLVAHTPEALAGLLRFLLSVDLVHRLVLGKLPLDHPVREMLVDEGAFRTTGIGDETWLRLVDVEAALAARTFTGEGEVTVAVTDRQLPANTGTYRIAAAGTSRTPGPPDLSVDVATLAAAYLGGTRWWQVAAGGRVQEHTRGAVAVADELFRTDRMPFSGTMF